jgi:hypothetical protein
MSDDNKTVKVTKPTGKPFVVRWWARDYIVMPPKYLNDVRGANGRHLNFFYSIGEVRTPISHIRQLNTKA